MNESKAKNIIIFIGDGMSLPTITASRIYKAQRNSGFSGSVMGEESSLFFESLPHVALSKVRILLRKADYRVRKNGFWVVLGS